jgi:integrase
VEAADPAIQALRRVQAVPGNGRVYRTCVIGGIPEHSPAEHVRRPSVPAGSPAPGFTHLQSEALLTAARDSPDPCDLALAAMPGLLGLRIFQATGTNIGDLGEHGHRVLRVCGKGTKVILVPLPPAAGKAIERAAGIRYDRSRHNLDRHPNYILAAYMTSGRSELPPHSQFGPRSARRVRCPLARSSCVAGHFGCNLSGSARWDLPRGFLGRNRILGTARVPDLRRAAWI